MHWAYKITGFITLDLHSAGPCSWLLALCIPLAATPFFFFFKSPFLFLGAEDSP